MTQVRYPFLLGLCDLGFGLALILATPERSIGPAFTAAKQIASLDVWGAVALVLGLSLAASCRFRGYLTPQHSIRAIHSAAIAAAGWLSFWWFVLLSAVIFDQSAGTGLAAYGGLIALHIKVATDPEV